MTDDLLARGRQLDAADPLAGFRDEFVVADPELIYLDGSSLGRLPKATRDRLRHAVDVEWGENLDRGWDRWNALARETGDVLAGGALGAAPGEVTLSDSTGVNLFRLAAAACDTRVGRSVIVTDEDTSPANRYVLEGLAAGRGMAVVGQDRPAEAASRRMLSQPFAIASSDERRCA